MYKDDVAAIYNGYYSALRTNEILSFPTIMDGPWGQDVHDVKWIVRERQLL